MSADRIVETWDWVQSSPAFGLLLTLIGYRIGRELQQRVARPWLKAVTQPVLVAMVVVGAVLLVFDIDYADYLVGASLIVFLLGPATVALAVPLYRQVHHLRRLAVPILVALPLAAAVSITLGLLLVRWLGGSEELALSMAPKAATTPVAIALAEQIGGIGPLAAALAVTIGVFGAVAGPGVLTLLRIRDRRARGLAIGAVSHGIGTARALADHPVEGAFAGLSMGLTALAISVLVPLLLLVL
ncbi:LrgB family protein [Nocardioides limicola]|uniref:LrgB family protein n=1 Tax=Nocardioides limicola TaxID=2803368 RepID=UPI00193C5337|nr:LrgB family protein [Nocardioides sp. DJM-14]